MLTVTKDVSPVFSYPPERLGALSDLLFFDIETTGFSARRNRLYLIGCLYREADGWKLVQWFADRKEAEPELLSAFFDLLAIQWGDASAQAPAYCTRLDHVRRLETMARQELAQAPCLTVRDLAVGGEDLLARGYRGPAVGEALRALLDQVLAGTLPNEKTPLLQWLARRDAEKREKTELPKAPPRP